MTTTAPAPRRRTRRARVFPAPRWSSRAYVRVERSKIGLFRFLLESWDNLALFTMVDRSEGVLMLRFCRDQEREVRSFLEAARSEMPVEVVYWPDAAESGLREG